jgi:histidinol-phosphate aminotransferase
MSLSRRSFFRTLGAGSAAGLSTSFIIGRGREAMAFELGAPEPVYDGGFIRISSNENARGPGKKAIEAIQGSVSARMGRGYPPDHTDDLVDAIAGVYSVKRDNVIVGTGSGPILEAAVRAYCTTEKGLVSAAPTYQTCDQTARRMNVPIKVTAVTRALALDLDAIGTAAKGAGLVYLCNPNNPTGLAHNQAAVEKLVRRIKQESPDTAILIDEAYIDYAHDSAIKTAAPLTQELKGVFITRSFSKAHGMAGLRLGYAIGQQETLQAMSRAWQLGSLNTLTAAAGAASLRDTQHIADERAENARVRDFTLQAFKSMGYEGLDSHANCIFVNLNGRSAPAFRDACAAQKIRIGRDFPPFEKTHTRISLGTMDEMRQSVDVFRKVLTSKPSTGGF